MKRLLNEYLDISLGYVIIVSFIKELITHFIAISILIRLAIKTSLG